MSCFARFVISMMLCAVAADGVARAQSAPAPALDPRLGTEHDRIARALAVAERDGLPVELLQDKLREGLAKNVPPPRITVALTRLVEALTGARTELAGRERPSARLYRAVVDAHGAGAGRAEVAAVLAASSRADSDGAARALEVLGDLARRGFPSEAAARTVAQVERLRPDLLGKLVGEAESLRRAGLASPAQALDALERAVQRSKNFDEAGKLMPNGARERNGAADEHGPDRETQGSRGKKK